MREAWGEGVKTYAGSVASLPCRLKFRRVLFKSLATKKDQFNGEDKSNLAQSSDRDNLPAWYMNDRPVLNRVMEVNSSMIPG